MEDEFGNVTSDILAGRQKGTASGFHVPSLAKAIFTKAQAVVRDYPNAKTYTAITELKNSEVKLNIDSLMYSIGLNTDKESDEFVDSIADGFRKLTTYLEVYVKTKRLLNNQDDSRSKMLLKEVVSDCRQLLSRFKQ